MNRLHLIVVIAGERVALAANRVEAVVELGPVTPVPKVAPHILGLAAMRSRVLTVIDTGRAVGLAPAGADSRSAVVVEVDGHPYALTVDAIEDVVSIDGEVEPVAASLAPGWTAVADGMVSAGRLALRLDPQAVVRAR